MKSKIRIKKKLPKKTTTISETATFISLLLLPGIGYEENECEEDEEDIPKCITYVNMCAGAREKARRKWVPEKRLREGFFATTFHLDAFLYACFFGVLSGC